MGKSCSAGSQGTNQNFWCLIFSFLGADGTIVGLATGKKEEALFYVIVQLRPLLTGECHQHNRAWRKFDEVGSFEGGVGGKEKEKSALKRIRGKRVRDFHRAYETIGHDRTGKPLL